MSNLAVVDAVFFCFQCQAPIDNAVNFGDGYYRLICHGQSEMAQLDGSGDPKNPNIKTCFVTKGRAPGEPNVRFYCANCDAISTNWQHQRDPNNDKNVFIVICAGRICQGQRHTVVYPEKELSEREAWTTVVPLLLPMNARMIGKVGARKTTVQFIDTPKVVRKLRLE